MLYLAYFEREFGGHVCELFNDFASAEKWANRASDNVDLTYDNDNPILVETLQIRRIN